MTKRWPQRIDEHNARRIWSTPTEIHSYDECVACDAFIKAYALKALEHKMRVDAVPNAIRVYLRSCVAAHFGAVETDTMLQAMDCYPKWMTR